MADPKVPARRGQLPSVLGDIGRPADLTAGPHWFGPEGYVLERNTNVVGKSTGYLDARRRQSDAYVALIDARMRIASKIAELVDLPNRIADEQSQREHVRWQAHSTRELERTHATYEHKKALGAASGRARAHRGECGSRQPQLRSRAARERCRGRSLVRRGTGPHQQRARGVSGQRRGLEAHAADGRSRCDRRCGSERSARRTWRPSTTKSICSVSVATTRPCWRFSISAHASRHRHEFAIARLRHEVSGARPRRQVPARNSLPDFTSVMIGHDPDGKPIYLGVQTLMRHLRALGTTGSGKTTFLKNFVIQWIRNGFGGILFDPHGSHPGSLLNELCDELERAGFFATRRVHVVDLNITSLSTPFDFLGLNDTDLSVIADAFLEAISVAFKGEDLYAKPTIRNRVRTLIMALADLKLPLADAELFLDPYDRAGVRERAIERLSNPYAKEALQQLHFISLERSKHDFRAEVVGPLNRLAEFLSCEAVRIMLGVVDEPDQPRRTLDILHGMDNGHIYLINLQHGRAISEANAALVGALLFRYIFLLCSRRRNREPFLIVADEFQKIASGDLPNLLAEARKFSVGCILSHQYLRQLGTPDDILYQAPMHCVGTDVVFQIADPTEAQIMGERVLPLNLERPVSASVRPTVVGHRRVQLASRSRTDSEAVTEGEAETVGEMHAMTDMESHAEALGEMTTTMTGAGSFDGIADSSGTLLSPPAQLLGPNAPNASLIQYPLSESIGQVASHGSSEQSAEARGTSRMSVTSRGSAETHASSRGSTRSSARSKAVAHTAGEQEGFEPLYADLPSAWHSIEAERYRAGEILRALPVGRCIVRSEGRTCCVTVPPPKRQS